MRSTYCRGNAFDPRFVYPLFPFLCVTQEQRRSSVYTWTRSAFDSPACSTGHRRCDPAGQVTRRLQVSQRLRTIEFLTFWLMFEIEEQLFPPRSGAHHPEPIEKESRGSPLFGIHLLQTGKYAEIWFGENPAIVQHNMKFFFPSVILRRRNTEGSICLQQIYSTPGLI